MSIEEIEQEIIEEFEIFDDWMGKYEFLIDMGKSLPMIEEKYKTDDKLIKGCQSRVWMHSELKDGKVIFTADSDAIITKGMVALMVRVLSNHTPDEIINAKLEFVDKIGLTQHLSPTRSNGLVSMIKQMKMDALAYKVKQSTIKMPAIINTHNTELTQQVIDTIKTCYDPEIPVDIWELGLIYEINIDEENNLLVKMTLTSPSCPVAETLPPEVEQKLREVVGIRSAKIELTFEPPWEKDMMSEVAQLELGFM